MKIGKLTENEFIGVNSGIMDQFAIGMRADLRAIYLDTNTLEYDLVRSSDLTIFIREYY